MVSPSEVQSIRIRGARVHNLRSIDLDIPHNQITVITGVSGSGKSSFAFDTLFAEGQRQYLESLSAYARQFLDQMPRPDVDRVDGLQPTLCIDQKTGATHPRSTVATVTEIYDYLRLLYARVGIPHCVACGEPVSRQSVDQVIASLGGYPAETSMVLLAPMIRGRRGTHGEIFEQIRRNGWVRARVDGVLYPLDELPELAPRKLHTIEAVVDRLVLRPGNESRLVESARLALQTGGGVLTLLTSAKSAGGGESAWEERLFSTLNACPGCGQSFQELEPRTFSFNSPYGACPSCDGLGVVAGSVCGDCRGGRLRPEALAVTLAEQNIASVTALSVRDGIAWFDKLAARIERSLLPVADRITGEVIRRLRFLDSVGLHYLSLNRPAATLSGGEHQRVRLATSLGSGLVGVCYVLDEPSIGLHPSDNERLIGSLRALSSQGNTVVVVEHDESMMWAADRLVDFGPGAGPKGGRVISQGTPAEVAADPASVTGAYLSGKRTSPIPLQRREPQRDRWVELVGVRTHNLQNITARFPLGLLVGVTGVSGSGKSSLVNDTLVPAIQQRLDSATTSGLRAAEAAGTYQLKVKRGQRAAGAAEDPGADESPTEDESAVYSGERDASFAALRGGERIEKLIRIDQRPIGRGPRSCPATYSGVLDEIRKVFAATREAKQRGFGSSRFSFNASAGRCDGCQGQGLQKIEMNFLSDLFIVCPRCGGKRYNRQTLAIRFKGRSIADVLEMTIEEATEFFENFPRIHHLLASLRDIGLGYLRLGQPSTTLSGGEAQRIKLGTELARPPRGHTLYVLDEPTTGLHFEDVERLIHVLRGLVETDSTVIVIEHNLEVVRACDWLIDIGPGGGAEGGRIIGQGTPEQLAANTDSATGRFLAANRTASQR